MKNGDGKRSLLMSVPVHRKEPVPSMKFIRATDFVRSAIAVSSVASPVVQEVDGVAASAFSETLIAPSVTFVDATSAGALNCGRAADLAVVNARAGISFTGAAAIEKQAPQASAATIREIMIFAFNFMGLCYHAATR